VYFDLFPTITYSNTVVTDVTRRVVMPQSVLRQPTAFFPYTVEGEQRQDLVSYLYYGQDDDDWIISLANQIVDPYYGWFLGYDEFNSYVIGKYGDLPTAMTRIHHWATNWATDSREISTGYYDALTDNLRKYWVPNFGQGVKVLSYSRRQEDWTASTNVLLNVSLSSAAPFQTGDLAAIRDTGGNQQGTGEVVYVSGSNVVVKDVQGTWANGYTVVTPSGNGIVSAIGSNTATLPIDEVVYYGPVTCYDFEYDANEELKEILLVSDSYRNAMYSELTAALASAPQA
jgi:hypothetical protein